MSDVGNPLLNQPPTTVNVGDVASHEVDPRNDQKLRELGKLDAGSAAAYWAARAAHQVDAPGLLISTITGLIDQIIALATTLLTAAQGEHNSGFYDLAAKVVEDLTGVPVDAAQLKQSTFGSGRLAGMETLGGNIFDLLQKEFAPNGTIDPDQGIAAAKTFLGFLMNFSIRQGNVETILSLIPEEYRCVEGIREYGELMAKNLGLGRLARRALAPLIQTTIADPLTWKLNLMYRPKMLSEGLMIKRFFREPETKDRMTADLQKLGYPDTTIDDLVADARPLLSESQIVDLAFRFGQDVTSVKTALAQRGWTPDETQTLIDLQRPELQKSEIAHLYQHGTISRTDAIAYLGKLGYDATTADLVLQAHTAATVHIPQIHFGELRRLMQENVIDVIEFQDRLTAQGYSSDDVKLLTLDALHPVKTKEKMLGLAEIKAGYKAGFIPAAQVIIDLEKLGYSSDDAKLILNTMPTAKATTVTKPATTG